MAGSRLVYSTDGDNTCPVCNKPRHKCHCDTQSQPEPSDGTVRLQLEKKGRGGKQVTVITGLLETTSNQKPLVKKLKSLCGTGGTIKGTAIEIQGDHRKKLQTYLEGEGFQTKLSGG